MKQNTNQIFKAEDLDWKELETSVINIEYLEGGGNMELLLQGEATEAMPLKICTPILHITMDATLKLTAGTDGKPVMEIYGLSPEAEEATGE